MIFISKDLRENKEIIIEFNQENYDAWVKDFKARNPKKRKLYVESPMVRSLNKMLVITNRVVQNNYKQMYKDYSQFVVKYYGLEMLGISKADLHIHFVFNTKIRHDLDNFVSGTKELLDGFSECGLIVDDDYYHIQSITATAEHIPKVTKISFRFENCEFDKVELRESLEKAKKKKESFKNSKKT